MESRQKTIFITGASGFIGPLLLKDLLIKNYNIITLLRNSGVPKKARIREIFQRAEIPLSYTDRVTVAFGDITQKNLGLTQGEMDKLRGRVSEVWHLAASLSFRRRDTEKNTLTNLEGTKNVAEFASDIESEYFFYASTVYIRGSDTGIVYERPIARPKSFTNSYEQTKWEAEDYIIGLSSKNLITVILRLSIVVGNEKYVPETIFGYYHFLAGILDIKKAIINSPRIVKFFLTLAGIRVKDNEIYSKIPFPCIHNKHLNLVPVDKIVYLMSRISDYHRRRTTSGIFIYNLADPNPISLSALFHETFRGLGMYIPIVHTHSMILKLSFRLVILVSAIVPPLKRFSRSIKYYQTYLLEEAEYDIQNTSRISGRELFSSTLLAPQELKKLIRGFLLKVARE